MIENGVVQPITFSQTSPQRIEVDDDPLAFVEGLYGMATSNTSSSQSKRDKKGGVQNHHYIYPTIATERPWIDNRAGYDKASVYANKDIINNVKDIKPITIGHMMIHMVNINKYFCTHCLGTIESIKVNDHLAKCFFANLPDHAHYCPLCNSKNTADSAQIHFNSAKHMARAAYITELVKQDYIFVDADGMSHAANSTQSATVAGYAVSTSFLIDRIRIATEIYNKFAISGGKQLFRLMSSLIQNKDKGSDDIGASLVQKNSIVKCFQFFSAEVNARRKLCYPESAVKNDFITVQNCFEALYEINMDMINKLDTTNDVKADKRAKINALFKMTTPAEGNDVQCFVCKNKHRIQFYDQPAALCRMIDLLLSQLKD